MSQFLVDIEKLITPLLEGENVELVDVTYQKQANGWTLCFILDKNGGISLDDCQGWSRKIEEQLDQSGIITHSYNLEVSSPGVYRPLKKEKDFLKFSGERVAVRLFAPLEGQKNFKGILNGIENGVIKVQLSEKGEVQLPLSQIAKAHLDPQINV